MKNKVQEALEIRLRIVEIIRETAEKAQNEGIPSSYFSCAVFTIMGEFILETAGQKAFNDLIKHIEKSEN